MYLVLVPVERLGGARGDYYEAHYMGDAVEVGRSLKREGVRAYKLDNLTQLSEIRVHTTEFEAGK